MIENIKVFAADIDGTLRQKGEDLGDINRQALEQLHSRGVLMGLASGRPFDQRILDNAKQWNLSFEFDFAICCNGAQLWSKHDNQVRVLYNLDQKRCEKIVRTLDANDFNAINYINGYELVYTLKLDRFLEDSLRRNGSIVEFVSVDKMCQFPANKIELHYEDEREDDIQRLARELSKEEGIKAVKTHTNCMEFVDPRVNKGVALKEYCKIMNIDINDVISFGDMDNDYELIRDAGWGVCLKNGCDACKSVAKAITEYECDEGGVGHYLFDYYLNK